MPESNEGVSRAQSGPHSLGGQADAFAVHLGALGYAPLTIKGKLCFVRQLTRWMEAERLPAEDLVETLIDQSLGLRRCTGDRRRTLLQFLDHLREEGVAPPREVPVDGSPVVKLEQRYARYLREERGLVDVTVVNYGGFVRRFLVEQFRQGPVELAGLTSRHVADFLLRHVRTMSPKRAQLMGCALRSFLRFLFLEAETTADLSLAVPTVRQFRKITVPQYLAAADVERVVASCDLAASVGRRDHAILLLLARLGLRASEIVKLELGDLRWRDGELVVRGKGSLHDRLPLPKEVAKALALYLTRARATCSSRRVFLRMRAPLRGFTNSAAVTTIVERAIERAGLRPPHRGAHLFRHSLATGMIQHGASMAEIGQLLRHRSPNTTELYAKVDFEGLRGVSLTWVGAGGGR